jgi:MFS family permease
MQRADRNFHELLQELRVTQTGVQILFAFLLGLSFTPRFATINEFQRDVYVVTLVASAITTALLIAPVAAHRLQFQRGRKVALVLLVHRCVLAGLVSLLVTMAGAMLLVLDVVLGAPAAVSVSAVVAGGFTLLWFVLPGYRRFTSHRDEGRPSRPAAARR